MRISAQFSTHASTLEISLPTLGSGTLGKTLSTQGNVGIVVRPLSQISYESIKYIKGTVRIQHLHYGIYSECIAPETGQTHSQNQFAASCSQMGFGFQHLCNQITKDCSTVCDAGTVTTHSVRAKPRTTTSNLHRARERRNGS